MFVEEARSVRGVMRCASLVSVFGDRDIVRECAIDRLGALDSASGLERARSVLVGQIGMETWWVRRGVIDIAARGALEQFDIAK